MDIQFFCPRWGSEHLEWDVFFQQVVDAGYTGVEYAIASNVSRQQLDEIWNKAEKYGATMLAQHFDTCTADFNEHYDSYIRWFEKIKDYPVVKINSQTGKDFFSVDQNTALLVAAAKFSADNGIEVLHETHRNKFSFAAHITRTYLETLPNLRLTLDASHWVCVAESWLEDQQPTMELAISRTHHIHARVGHPEGPQIPDPRAPEWQASLDRHLTWWDAVIAQRQTMTITTEFGPPPYLVELPFSRKPIASQWEINTWMLNLLKNRYITKDASSSSANQCF